VFISKVFIILFQLLLKHLFFKKWTSKALELKIKIGNQGQDAVGVGIQKRKHHERNAMLISLIKKMSFKFAFKVTRERVVGYSFGWLFNNLRSNVHKVTLRDKRMFPGFNLRNSKHPFIWIWRSGVYQANMWLQNLAKVWRWT
jgi:hypothetical protein